MFVLLVCLVLENVIIFFCSGIKLKWCNILRRCFFIFYFFLNCVVVFCVVFFYVMGCDVLVKYLGMWKEEYKFFVLVFFSF